MTRFAFIYGVLFSLYLISYQCEGGITSPPDGTEYIFLPGQTAKIKWEFNDAISTLRLRLWSFTSSDGSLKDKSLASIFKNGPTDIETRSFEVDIERPATLVLKNVNQSYTGIYRFSFTTSTSFASDVMVSIANAPIVTFSCPSPTTVNEGDNFTCTCRSQGGNPPANVTWYKDGVQIGETGMKEQILTLSNIDKTDSGKYKCVAQSHTLTDERSIEIIVYCAIPPVVVSLRSTPENVVFGESVVIMCEAIAVPLPSYTIIHNDTKIVSTHKTYIITVLNHSHSGLYKCIATNHLGNSSKTLSFSVAGKAALEESNRNGTEWYIIVVSLVSGIIIGIFLSYIVSCSRRKFSSRNPQSNPERPATEVDTTYQELDLTKMNAEDNYQSLRVNAARIDAGNDNDSTYTELNKTRDVENNYQPLT